MASNVTAYVGCDCFDIILYLSRILQKLGRKVLIADYNLNSALTYSIPRVGGIDAYRDINTYMNIDFTRKNISRRLISQYDDVLIDCGFSEPVFDINMISNLVYATDMYGFNLKKLRCLSYYDRIPAIKELLIREATDIGMSVEEILSIIKKDIDKVRVLNYDEGDYQNSLMCHYNQMVRFVGISSNFKKYLLDELEDMVGEIPYRRLKSAYNRAKRGERRRVLVHEYYPVLVTFPWARANK